MATNITKYSDISPRTTAYADRRLLKRAVPNNILGQFGQVRQLPGGKSDTIKFRRYEKLAVATTPLVEGVTPTGSQLTKTDLSVQLKQYGDFVTITDYIRDTHEDPVLREASDILGEQAGETYDILRAGVLKAGTNVLYTTGTQRTDVKDVIGIAKIRTAVRTLKRQEAKQFTRVIKAGPNIGTMPIPASFIAVSHCDLQPDLEGDSNWIPVHKYANMGGLIQGEAGVLGEVRWIFDNNLTAWLDGGAAVDAGQISNGGSNCDVYPVLIFARDSYALVPLAGKGSVRTYVNNPKAQEGDPLAQRGTVGWKGYHACIILNDNWMIRIETAAKG